MRSDVRRIGYIRPGVGGVYDLAPETDLGFPLARRLWTSCPRRRSGRVRDEFATALRTGFASNEFAVWHGAGRSNRGLLSRGERMFLHRYPARYAGLTAQHVPHFVCPRCSDWL